MQLSECANTRNRDVDSKRIRRKKKEDRKRKREEVESPCLSEGGQGRELGGRSSAITPHCLGMRADRFGRPSECGHLVVTERSITIVAEVTSD